MSKRPTIRIAQDSREQRGLERYFAAWDCEVIAGATLPVFDYALALESAEGELRMEHRKSIGGLTLDVFAVERKSPDDFLNSWTTTHGKLREIAKLERAGFAPIVYVVEGRLLDLLPTRACVCVRPRASTRCKVCRGEGEPFCECIAPRPVLGCEFCNGSGVLGHDFDRRRIDPQFGLHMVTELVMRHGVVPLFADSAQGAARLIAGILRRRYEMLQIAREAKRGKGAQ